MDNEDRKFESVNVGVTNDGNDTLVLFDYIYDEFEAQHLLCFRDSDFWVFHPCYGISEIYSNPFQCDKGHWGP